MMFTFEDMTTDSTSVLKDFRHPSLNSVNLATSKPGPHLGRVVSFSHSMSQTQTTTARREKKSYRHRYMSEGHQDHPDQGQYGSKLFIIGSANDVSKSGQAN